MNRIRFMAWCVNVGSTYIGLSIAISGARTDLFAVEPISSSAPVLQSQPVAPFIGRREVIPNWFNDVQFWYVVQTGRNSREFVLVNAADKSTLRANSREELQQSGKWPESTDSTVHRIVPSDAQSDDRITVTFKNETSKVLELNWIGADARPRSYATIRPGASASQSTFVGHSWVAVDENRVPVWTAKAFQPGEILAMTELKIEPSPIFDRRPGRSDDSNSSGPWTFERDANNLIFKSKSGDKSFSTANMDCCAGTAAEGYNGRVIWSPDGKYAFTLQTRFGDHREITIVESSPRDQTQPKLKTVRYDKPGDKLDVPIVRLIDLEQQRAVSIDATEFANPWSIDDVRWSSDGSRITFIYNERGHKRLRLIAIEPSTGTTKVLIDETSSTYIDYVAKAYREYLTESNEVIWASERDGWYHLYLYDSQTGQLKNQITKGNWVVRSIERIDREQRQIWFYAGGIVPGMDPYYRQLCRVNFDGTQFVQITSGDGDHRCAFSPSRKVVIDTYSRVDMAPVHELRSATDGSLILELERGDARSLWSDGLAPPERFTAKGRDGETDIYGIMVRPKNFDPTKRYPIIENIYAGPQDSFVPKSFSTFDEYYELANKGFIVVKIDGMGTSNRSKKFHDVSYRNLSDGGFPDRILWMKAAAEKHPEMDIDHVGIYGGSAGGQNALAAVLFFGDFYDAAVADCGCHDNRMDKVWWNELYMGWPIAEHYTSNSNVVNAHRLRGKLMLTVGELDTNVDPSSTMQVVDALIRADKDFELIVVPGAGHGVGSSPYCRRRRDDFFIRHLMQ